MSGTGNAIGTAILTIPNPLTISAQDLILTLTGPTNVTLPETGILITDAVTTLSSLTSIGTIATGVWQATAIGGNYGGTGVDNGVSTITLGGNLVTSGSDSLTLTTTGPTNVTLPTTGTLVTTAGTVANATNIAITDDTTTNATMYPAWVTAATGNLPAKVSSTKLTFNPSTAVLTTTTFAGALSGNATTATTATNATNTAITDDTTTNATMYPTWVTAATGNLPQKVSSTKMSFNPSTGLLTTTSYAGAWAGTAIDVAHGGTGVASTTAYAVLCGGTTSTAALQSIASVGSSGDVLTSNGAGALPTFQATGATSGRLIGVTIYSSGTNTFTPNAAGNTYYVYVLGGGGGGGGVAGGGGGTVGAGGGGSGGFAYAKLSKAQMIGAGTTAQAVVGALGAGGTSGANTGSTGGTSTLKDNGGAGATLISCSGGVGGLGGTVSVASQVINGGAGGGATISSGTSLAATSVNGTYGLALGTVAAGVQGGGGAITSFASGGRGSVSTGGAGGGASGPGAGGAGAFSSDVTSYAGGDGTAGAIIIYEYS